MSKLGNLIFIINSKIYGTDVYEKILLKKQFSGLANCNFYTSYTYFYTSTQF